VSEFVHVENLLNTISQKTNEGNFTQFWSQGFLHVLLTFEVKVKGQGHIRWWPKNCVNAISS